MAEQEKRKFGVVKRPSVRQDFYQWVLEGFIDYKGWQRLGLILLGGSVFIFLLAYFPAILLVGITILPFYPVVHWLVGKSRRKKYAVLLIIRLKHKKVMKKVTVGDNFNVDVETIETTSDTADIKLVPENVISSGRNQNAVEMVNTVERRMRNGRKLYIGEDMSIDQEEDAPQNMVKQQKGSITVFGAPDESFGNVALLTAISGITVKVNAKFEKTLRKIEQHGTLDPEDIARIRHNIKQVYDLIDQANDIIYGVQEEIQMFPFEPIDIDTIKRKYERQFIVGVGNWKGEWAEKMKQLGEYRKERPDTLMPHMLSLAEQSNIVSQQLMTLGLFAKQMQGRATLAALKQLLDLFGYDSEEIRRVIEIEVKRKGLIPTTDLEKEQEEEKEEEEEAEE
jgi:hypothetical protein